MRSIALDDFHGSDSAVRRVCGSALEMDKVDQACNFLETVLPCVGSSVSREHRPPFPQHSSPIPTPYHPTPSTWPLLAVPDLRIQIAETPPSGAAGVLTAGPILCRLPPAQFTLHRRDPLRRVLPRQLLTLGIRLACLPWGEVGFSGSATSCLPRIVYRRFDSLC